MFDLAEMVFVVTDRVVDAIRPIQLCGTFPPFVRTVNFKTVLGFFHLSNLANASVDEAIFLHILRRA